MTSVRFFKTLAAFLALALMLSLCSLSIFADEPEVTTAEGEATTAAPDETTAAIMPLEKRKSSRPIRTANAATKIRTTIVFFLTSSLDDQTTLLSSLFKLRKKFCTFSLNFGFTK